MSNIVNALLITGDARRHRYVASGLGRKVNLVGIVAEKKYAVTDEKQIASNRVKEIITRHFTERDEVEKNYWVILDSLQRSHDLTSTQAMQMLKAHIVMSEISIRTFCYCMGPVL